MNQLSKFPYPKHIEAHEPGDDIAPYEHIYKAFTSDRNLAMVRSQKNWERLLKRDPYKDLEFTFLCRDDSGNGISYILYSKGSGEWGNALDIKECCWSTPEGLQQILGFMGRLSAEFEAVNWNAPCDVNVHALCPEGYEPSLTIRATGMNRVVDVSAGLATLNAPVSVGGGKVHVEIVDAYWPSNSGVYAIEWSDGNLTVEKCKNISADMKTSVETLVQLITGYITPEEAVYKTCTTVHSAFADFNSLFPKKRLYTMEKF